jgi:phosphoserine phosphatase
MAVKLFFFDMEGTLFRCLPLAFQGTPTPYSGGLWAQLAHALGPDAVHKDAEIDGRWDRSDYGNYMEWCDASLRSLVEFGLNREVFDRVLGRAQYNGGVANTIAALKSRGIRTAIVSGGFAEQARRAQADLGIPHAFAAVDIVWTADGRAKCWNLLPCDDRGKVDFVRLLMQEYRMVADDCAFIGDGDNDVALAKAVKTSFALNGTPALRAASTFPIQQFSEVMAHI